MDTNADSPTKELTPAEVNEIIHSRRKVRYGTACYPCRKRKVKCDNQQPCQNCVRRDHAVLCSYIPKQDGGARASQSASPSTLPGSRKRAHSSSAGSDVNDRPPPKTELRSTDVEEPQSSKYVGQNSTLAFLSQQTRADGVAVIKSPDVIRKDILPILGMQASTAPYPFMSNEHIEKARLEVKAALPPDREVLQKFQIYRQVIHPFWQMLINVDEFEAALLTFLEDRSSRTSPARPVSMGWLGVVFAVMALATQYSDMVLSKRVTISQSLLQTSFQCLRLQNFLLRPSLETIQALLMVGLVLSNDMKTEASWAFLGLTARLAQSLGIHKPDEHVAQFSNVPLAQTKSLWWNVVWHDTLLSMTFDRPPVTYGSLNSVPLQPNSDGLSYIEALHTLFAKLSTSVKMDTPLPVNYGQIMTDVREIEEIYDRVTPRLQSKENCKTVQDRLQYYALRLHIAYIVSVECRPALSRSNVDPTQIAQKQWLADKCKMNLAKVVRMFLSMHPLSTLPTRSWSFIHHGLSSAVLLGILGETKSNPEVRELQGQLINVLSATAHGDQDTSLAGPLSKALAALRNMYEYGTINIPTAPSSTTDEVPGHRLQDQAAIDQQNAALAMTSLQNGNDGMNGDYQPEIQPSDPLEMSPMDLFDSIFWDPTMVSNDQPFDYTQQFYPF